MKSHSAGPRRSSFWKAVAFAAAALATLSTSACSGDDDADKCAPLCEETKDCGGLSAGTNCAAWCDAGAHEAEVSGCVSERRLSVACGAEQETNPCRAIQSSVCYDEYLDYVACVSDYCDSHPSASICP